MPHYAEKKKKRSEPACVVYFPREKNDFGYGNGSAPKKGRGGARTTLSPDAGLR